MTHRRPDTVPVPAVPRVPGSANPVTHLLRAVRAEFAKLGHRSPLWYAVLPLAAFIPAALNFGIAKAAQLNKIDGSGGMDTNNAAYWIIVFSTFILMTGAVTSFCGEFRDGTVELAFAVQPRRWLLPVAKLIVFGGISGMASMIITFGIMWGYHLLFPDVWGRVDVFSYDGVRLWLGTPLLTVLVIALGLGLSALFPRPGLVVMLILLWKFGVEKFVEFLQGDFGILLQRWSPFRNAEIGAGQMVTFDSPFGGALGSMLYFAAIAIGFFIAGVVHLAKADLRSGD
ncbi:ABC transporter permease [Gordonia sp. (in: high G+C Gram-positive bacteria)]|jgi:ABC-2 type transport system permease protein|uniref:ABC transporter permease n=1 Tax=Gordonia sp. (in: high G+C Gram-positive bacteria) TaxID=84139 RepID=UPI001D5B98CB|nr:ABC transporter permease [Gordonia sp. (in: high G+C Gram-positive bacteria)]MCB1297024.1 ABC transporter permease [Gordonia sp. (in: high G+C Gram-positive bacteria)]HMS74501.1 ABC transporter permease [Gordonia sp. (in: high G+C Gram-positive bacteria)]